MNHMAASVLVLALVVVQVQRVSGADPDNTDTPAYYPWSETSAFVRLPKTFLDEVNILSVTNGCKSWVRPLEPIGPSYLMGRFALRFNLVSRGEECGITTISSSRTRRGQAGSPAVWWTPKSTWRLTKVKMDSL